MGQEQQRYIKCDVCGVSILEQCAIEESGQFLCGDCVVRATKKEVVIAEKISKEKRDKEYEIERNKTILKQKKRGVILFVATLVVLGITQLIAIYNQPEPLVTTKVDLETDTALANAMIISGINGYYSVHEKLPAQLKVLAPQYISDKLFQVSKRFHYQRLNDDSYELKIIQQREESTLNRSGLPDENK